METQIKLWGNSQGIRIPKDILQKAHVTTDDVLDIEAVDGVITLSKPHRHKTLEERAKAYNDKLNLDGEYDFGKPVGREVWK